MTKELRPISRAFDVPHGLLAAEIADVLRAIDRVHVDGLLPSIPLTWSPLSDRDGLYRFDEATGAPMRIIASSLNPRRRLAIVHEIGHFLDHQAMGRRNTFGSTHDRQLGPWRKAVRSSQAYQALAALSRRTSAPVSDPNGAATSVAVQSELVRYLGTYTELWARSYAQFIASRSNDPWLNADLDARRIRRPGAIYYHFQWSDDDFAPIATEIGQLFGRLGWLV